MCPFRLDTLFHSLSLFNLCMSWTPWLSSRSTSIGYPVPLCLDLRVTTVSTLIYHCKRCHSTANFSAFTHSRVLLIYFLLYLGTFMNIQFLTFLLPSDFLFVGVSFFLLLLSVPPFSSRVKVLPSFPVVTVYRICSVSVTTVSFGEI